MKNAKRLGFLLVTVLFLILTVGPFLWTFFIAVTPQSGLFTPDSSLLPKEITWSNFQILFSGTRKGGAFFTGIRNSLRAVVVTLAIGMPVAMMTSYPLACMHFPGRKLVKNVLLITMVIPVMATIIPLYKIFSTAKLLDNLFWLCVVYVSSCLPMVTWMMTNYLSSIPKEIEEAAKIDGCGELSVFFRIYLPLMRPIILSLTLIIFLQTWSRFQIPLILASSMETKPVAIVVSEFVTKDTTDYGLIAAAGLCALIPPALTAMVFKNYLIEGMIGKKEGSRFLK